MKFFAQNNKARLLPVILILVSVVSADALAANIKRSCKGTYYASVQSVRYDGKFVGLPYDVVQVGAISDAFSAEGGCGKLVPNRCRQRARNKLLACARAHVKSPNQLPAQCRPDKVRKYPGQNLQAIIKAKACKSRLGTQNMLKIRDFLPSQYELNVLLKIHVDGSDDCGLKHPGKVVINGKPFKREGNKLFVVEPLKYFTVKCP